MSRPPSSPRGPSQRQLRVGEHLRHILSAILNEGTVRDKELYGVTITVTEVRVSPDLRAATVFCTPLGGKKADAVVAALNRHKAFLRGAMGKSLAMRYTPDLTFRRDTSFEETARIEALLRSPAVRADLGRDDEEKP